MPEDEKQRSKTAATPPKDTRIVTAIPFAFSLIGTEPWREWTVKPRLESMPFPEHDPERRIGKRIRYCRGELDNLSVDALARYTKFFDKEGVSRYSLVRYEAGLNLPGARELRILCDTLWVPAGWLLFGRVDEGRDEKDILLHRWFGNMLKDYGALKVQKGVKGVPTMAEQEETAKRQYWINEARKPPKS